MQFSNIFSEERAVSPVIGVILMVAITVILAAVIGTFVLGLSDQIGETNPRASFGFDQTTVDIADSGGTEHAVTAVTITHESGESMEAANLEVTVDGKTAYTEKAASGTGDDIVAGTFTGTVSAGSSITILGATDASADVTTGTSKYVYDTTNSHLDIDKDGTLGGGTVTNDVGIASDQTIRVVWTNADGDSSTTVAKHTVN